MDTRSKEDPTKIVSGSTVFLDHILSFITVYNQVTLGTSDTTQSKELCESNTQEHGLTVKSYRSDNGIFKSVVFVENLETQHQKLSLVDANAHGQNGVNKCKAQTAVNSTYTIMSQ
jgi:hypothetical protein